MQETNISPVEAVASEINVNGCSHYDAVLLRQQAHPRGTGQVKTPAGTRTHKPMPQITVVEKLIEAPSFRRLGVSERNTQSQR